MARAKKSKTGRGEFATLVAKLRTSRGMTQDDLAVEIGADKETIARVEQDRGGPWRPAISRKVFEALFRRLPIEEAEARSYIKLAQLETGLYEHVRSLHESSLNPANDDLNTQAAPLLADMAKAIGIDQTIAMLRGCWIAVATLQRAGVPSAYEDPTFIVPRGRRFNRKLNAFEETEVEYGVAKPKKPDSQTKLG